MSDQQHSRIRLLKDILKKYRKYVWVAAIVALYAVLGFFLTPWLLQKNLAAAVRDNSGGELRISKIEVNPFVLSLRIINLELDDPNGAATVRADEIFINFQLSSLFRLAWTFDEFRISSPEIFIARNETGDLSLAYLFEGGGSTEGDDEQTVSSPTPLLIFNFEIADCAINWRDEVPVDLIETRFAPINIKIHEFNTLPQRSGQQTVHITTESTGTLSWTGSLELNPLRSAGHASVKGSHFPLTTAYIHHETGFDIVEGNADAELEYTIDTLADGTIKATVDDFQLVFNDIVVHTFSGVKAADATVPDREVLRLPEIRLTDGRLRWPERSVSFAALTLDDALVSILRDESGSLNIARRPVEATEETADEEDSSGDDEWQFSLHELAINHLALDLEDHSVEPFADVGIADLNLSIRAIDNEPATRFPTRLSMQARTGGILSLEGELSVLPELIFDLDLKIDNMMLAGAHPYIKPLADLHMESGALNLTGHLSNSSQEPLLFNGDVAIVDFEITETDEGTRLGSWERLSADNVSLSIAGNDLAVSEIHLLKAYGDIVIAGDGSLNLGRVGKVDQGPDTDDERAGSEAGPEPVDDLENSRMAVTVGRVVVTDATADFTDHSLPLSFSAKIEELNGSLTTISTASSEASAVSFEGKVDEYGFVRVTGSITPLDPAEKTDIAVSFQNINVPKFTAYTIPFAGREIASGNLDLELGYQVTDSQLVGENNIVLRNFELGEKVEHPDAMSLPLGLAVALLKDPDGRIDLDLPVRGDLDDPEFSYGGIVWKALSNLIIKIVASPFALLGKLVGVEASDLEYINFIEGRSDLTPPEMEKAAKLAVALSLRPELALEIAGVVDPAADGLAIRINRLDAIVEERIAAMSSDDDSEAMFSEQQTSVLEQLFSEQQTSQDSRLALQELRTQFTTQTEASNDESATVYFDELAYTNELRRQLIDLQPLTTAELDLLALKRAENCQNAVLMNNDSLRNRVVLTESGTVTKESGEMIKMNVTISTAGGGGK